MKSVESENAAETGFEMLKREVDSIQVKLLSTTTPWYRQASTLISLLAFLFSFGTTVVSCDRAAEQDRHNWKQELRGLILQIVEMPLKNVDLFDKYKTKPLMLGNISSMLNQESSILADQAALVISKIPDLVTANEYLAVAGAFHNGGLLDRAKDMRDKAIEVSATPIEAITALRQLAGMAFQRGDVRNGRAFYQEALVIFDKPRFTSFRDPGVVSFTNSYTELYWAQVEAVAKECDAFHLHLVEAKNLAATIPAGGLEQALAQIGETESYGCPPVFPTP
jgi:hypothetical protein